MGTPLRLRRQNSTTASFESEQTSRENDNLTFHHEPLQVGQIRLIKLRPGCADDEVRLHITQHDLSSAPIYRALSYCWGHETDRVPIQIGAEQFRLMPNAWWMLQHLREEEVGTYL